MFKSQHAGAGDFNLKKGQSIFLSGIPQINVGMVLLCHCLLFCRWRLWSFTQLVLTERLKKRVETWKGMSEYSRRHWSVGAFTVRASLAKLQQWALTLTSVMVKTGEGLECFAQCFHAQMAFNLQHFQPASSHTKPWNSDTYVTLNCL